MFCQIHLHSAIFAASSVSMYAREPAYNSMTQMAFTIPSCCPVMQRLHMISNSSGQTMLVQRLTWCVTCRITVESHFLLELTRLCPHLQTLRIGGFTAGQAKSVRRALQSLGPTTQQPENMGSWEDDAGESMQGCSVSCADTMP